MSGNSRYLLVLYEVQQAESEPIAPGHVAERLDRSPAAVTEMLQRLAARGYLADEPYEGATFTDEGRAAAAELHHTYRTLVQVFRDVLAVEQYDAEARRMVGTVSPTVTERLTATLLETSPSSGPSADEQRS